MSRAAIALLGAGVALSACTGGATGSESALPSPSPPVASSGPAAPSAFTQAPPLAPGSRGDWVASDRPNLRALTVVVRAEPPAALGAKLRRLAARYAPLSRLFVAHAEESFGSGFVMVRREPERAFVVTNRHVVGLASRVRVEFAADGPAPAVPADVVYVHDAYDLAVLALPPGATSAREGFAVSTEAARDQDAVVASGYPGIGDEPSYQVTRGFVSNERFVFQDATGEQLYLQHTAPIDPGSSGGPLTTPDGKLLGVNTLKIRDREAAGMAVPAAVVQSALTDAVRGPSASAAAACEALLANVRGGLATLPALERMLGSDLVADRGFESLASLPRTEEWPRRFAEDPIGVFLRAIALRLQQGQNGAEARCVLVHQDGGSARLKARLAGAEQELTFAREQARWKLTRAALGAAKGRTFLDRFDAQRPAKKWKPVLR